MIRRTRGSNAGGTALKILIIEDEQLLADSIAEVLRRKGFEAEAVYDGETGAEYAELGVYDLLILDVMMPGLDGYTVARQVRARHLGTPILMLTARSGLEDRITGLNAGADYYLTKPFDTRELLACVNALLRRQGAQVNQLTLGNTSLDLSTAALSCGADSIRLSAREFDIMRLLLQAGERNLSKAALLERVWGYDSDAVENHVEVYVCFLRKKLASIGSNIRIESIRRLGYHGASHGHVTATLLEREGEADQVVSCHLGGSCSISAIDGGKSLNNSFGFSLQAGVFHNSRVGDMDAYIIPYLLKQGLTIDEITYGLEKNGGLLGISGVSNDLRLVEEAAQAGNERAALAVEMFVNSIVSYIGSYTAQLGGLKQLVFTGGIGENSVSVRRQVCEHLAFLGVKLSKERNESPEKDKVISADDSRVKVHVIPANEELGIARNVFRVVHGAE